MVSRIEHPTCPDSFLDYEISGSCMEVIFVWVPESDRGSGVGKALMTTAEMIARDRGITKIVLTSNPFVMVDDRPHPVPHDDRERLTTELQSWYRKLGFKQTRLGEGAGFNPLHMEKILPGHREGDDEMVFDVMTSYDDRILNLMSSEYRNYEITMDHDRRRIW